MTIVTRFINGLHDQAKWLTLSHIECNYDVWLSPIKNYVLPSEPLSALQTKLAPFFQKLYIQTQINNGNRGMHATTRSLLQGT